MRQSLTVITAACPPVVSPRRPGAAVAADSAGVYRTRSSTRFPATSPSSTSAGSRTITGRWAAARVSRPSRNTSSRRRASTGSRTCGSSALKYRTRTAGRRTSASSRSPSRIGGVLPSRPRWRSRWPTTAGRPTISSAELVDVGAGTDRCGLHGQGRRRQDGSRQRHGLHHRSNEAVWKRGALGVVHFTMSRSDLQDQMPWERIPVENADKTKQGTFAFVLSQREGKRLRAELAASKTPYHVRARVESTFREPASQAIVEAVIRGTTIHDQAIVLTGHLQEERFSANDDGSGCANVLEIARALKRMIDDGRIARPARDIRFWWVNEIIGRRAVLRRPSGRAPEGAREHQPGHGRRQAVGRQPRAVRDAAASIAAQLPRRRRAIDCRVSRARATPRISPPSRRVRSVRAATRRAAAAPPPRTSPSAGRSCRGSARASATTPASSRSTTTPTTRCSTWRRSASRPSRSPTGPTTTSTRATTTCGRSTRRS